MTEQVYRLFRACAAVAVLFTPRTLTLDGQYMSLFSRYMRAWTLCQPCAVK